MSWTSEFELPPQGPQVAPEDEPVAENGDSTDQTEAEPDRSEAEFEAESEPVGQGFELSDIPDDGPLDPSVFDGLFTDLTEPDDYVQPESFDLDEDDASKNGEDERSQAANDIDEDQLDEQDLAGDDDEQGELVSDEADEAEAEENDEENAVDEAGHEFFEDFDELLDEDLEGEIDQDEHPQDTHSEDSHSEDTDSEDADFEHESEDPDDEVEDFDEVEVETFDDDEVEAAQLDEELGDELEEHDVDLEAAEPAGFEDLDLDGLEFEDLEFEDLDSEEAGPGAAEPESGFKLLDSAALAQPPAATPPPKVIEEPLPAVATSPPIALDDPYSEQHSLPAEPYQEMPAAAIVDQLNPQQAAAPEKRRWPAFVTAIVIGGTLGIGGALVLTRLQGNGEDNNGSAQAPLVANEVSNEQTTDSAEDNGQENGGETTQASPTSSSPTSLLSDGQLVAHAIGFVPGTTELTETSQATLQLVAASVAELPPEPTTITVRTFTQATAEANRELSQQQAAAVGDYLASLGVEFGGLTLRGVGAAPLAPAMPVENFVVARASLRTTGVNSAVAAVGPFEIGVDPDSLQLRPESVRALSEIGDALNASAEGSVSLAGYSYDRPTDEANKAMAAAAVDAAREYLASAHQIDPERLLVLAPGSLPYVLGTQHGEHVEIKRGRSMAVDVAVHSIEQPLVSFAAGSDALSGAAAEELSRIAALLIDAQAQAVISVRSAGESSTDANNRLSGLQADTIASYLADTGLAEGQVRVYGVGDIARLRSDTATSEVTITVLP